MTQTGSATSAEPQSQQEPVPTPAPSAIAESPEADCIRAEGPAPCADSLLMDKKQEALLRALGLC